MYPEVFGGLPDTFMPVRDGGKEPHGCPSVWISWLLACRSGWLLWFHL